MIKRAPLDLTFHIAGLFVAAMIGIAAMPAAAQTAGPANEPIVAGLLPESLSPWTMVRDADIVVQAVMGGLAFASLVTWTIWLAKALELFAAKRKARIATRRLAEAESLDQAIRALGGGWTRSGPVADLAQAATLELRRSAHLSPEGIKERLSIQLSRIEVRAGRSMSRGTGVLATIGSTAPFVGLFGTVWGIMNAFIGISQTKTTSLAVVAPGIAEALFATAIGLVAAIPAVIIYNVFARSIAGYRALLADAAGEVMQHVSRDLDRGRLALVGGTPRPRGVDLAAAE
ncbi:outer membrane transport energization protein ExbB [Kaistia soli DSM 19436]|uniref:Biopolymer transport protein ExbB n=1 Tax=Kaistia soli DSM 19436 TaxID=1122133 RepID=A0A1M4VAS6_9HYPH|nr:outer membrane transport energization protein ExbB [Kaistia soli DSM 19436]